MRSNFKRNVVNSDYIDSREFFAAVDKGLFKSRQDLLAWDLSPWHIPRLKVLSTNTFTLLNQFLKDTEINQANTFLIYCWW